MKSKRAMLSDWLEGEIWGIAFSFLLRHRVFFLYHSFWDTPQMSALTIALQKIS